MFAIGLRVTSEVCESENCMFACTVYSAAVADLRLLKHSAIVFVHLPNYRNRKKSKVRTSLERSADCERLRDRKKAVRKWKWVWRNGLVWCLGVFVQYRLLSISWYKGMQQTRSYTDTQFRSGCAATNSLSLSLSLSLSPSLPPFSQNSGTANKEAVRSLPQRPSVTDRKSVG